MEEPLEPSFDEKVDNHNDPASATDEKKEAILEACRQRDLDALRALAELPGGFLTDEIRQQACKRSVMAPPEQHIDSPFTQGRYSWDFHPALTRQNPTLTGLPQLPHGKPSPATKMKTKYN
jgi:hypothetical protein